MKLSRNEARSTDKIASEFGQLVEDGRALLAEILDKPAAKAQGMRDTFDEVSDKLAAFQSSATRAARRGAKQGVAYARQADDYLHENPWRAVAGGVVLGVLATLWWNQRR